MLAFVTRFISLEDVSQICVLYIFALCGGVAQVFRLKRRESLVSSILEASFAALIVDMSIISLSDFIGLKNITQVALSFLGGFFGINLFANNVLRILKKLFNIELSLPDDLKVRDTITNDVGVKYQESASTNYLRFISSSPKLVHSPEAVELLSKLLENDTLTPDEYYQCSIGNSYVINELTTYGILNKEEAAILLNSKFNQDVVCKDPFQ